MAHLHHLFGLTDRQLADFVTRPLRIVLVVVFALVLRALLGRAIKRVVRSTREGRVERRITHLGERAPLLLDTSPAAAERRAQRAATVGVVLRSISNVVILVVTVATILGEVGINLAAIIAGAGIVGLAVGFGAQNLVRDFLSGLFLIIEDTYGVGDTVDLGPATGTVEGIYLRSTRIRDVHGTLWSVRNGEITRVGNYSQSWQRALIDVLIGHDQNLPAAREALLAAARGCAADPTFAGVVLDPPEVWGVDGVRPDGIMLRLAVRRRTGRDDFDRAVREHLVGTLQAAGVRLAVVPPLGSAP